MGCCVAREGQSAVNENMPAAALGQSPRAGLNTVRFLPPSPAGSAQQPLSELTFLLPESLCNRKDSSVLTTARLGLGRLGKN